MRCIDRQVEKEVKCCRRKGEAKHHQCGERQSVVDAEKSKCRRCREIEGYGSNDIKNRCEWFIQALVVNHYEWFIGFVLRLAVCSIGNGCESLRIVWVCAQIIANHSDRQQFRWFIDDGSGGLSVTVQGFIGDGVGVYRRRLLATDWVLIGLDSFGIGVGWVLLGTKVKVVD